MVRPRFFREQLTDKNDMNPLQEQMCQVFPEASIRDLAYPADNRPKVGQISRALDEDEVKAWDGTAWVTAAEESPIAWSIDDIVVSEADTPTITLFSTQVTLPAGNSFSPTVYNPASQTITLPNGQTREFRPISIRTTTINELYVDWAGTNWPTVAEMNSFPGEWRLVVYVDNVRYIWEGRTSRRPALISTAGVNWEWTAHNAPNSFPTRTAASTTATIAIERYNTPIIAPVRIWINRPHSDAATCRLNTSGGTATPGTDYEAVSNRLVTIPAGSTQVNSNVTVLPDRSTEGFETFNAVISEQSVGILRDDTAIVAIIDDEGPLTLALLDSSINEGSGGSRVMPITAALNTATATDVTFRWATRLLTQGEDAALPSGHARATPGQDYVPVSNRLATIPQGQTSTILEVQIFPDFVAETNEVFAVVASELSTGSLGQNGNRRGLGTAWCTITDNDGIVAGPIIAVWHQVRQPAQLIVDYSFRSNTLLTSEETLDWSITNIDVPTAVWNTFTTSGTITLPVGFSSGQRSIGFGVSPYAGFVAGTSFTITLSQRAGEGYTLSPNQLVSTVSFLRTS